MKKNFLTITPESGGGTASVSAVADPNLLAKERSTTINFSATGGGGLSRAVTAIQDPAFVYHILSNLCNLKTPPILVTKLRTGYLLSLFNGRTLISN